MEDFTEACNINHNSLGYARVLIYKAIILQSNPVREDRPVGTRTLPLTGPRAGKIIERMTRRSRLEYFRPLPPHVNYGTLRRLSAASRWRV